MEPELALTYDLKKSAEVTVTLTFAADAQLLDPEKAHLEPYVVRNHLLTQAANLCAKHAAIEMECCGKPKEEVLDSIKAEKAKRVAEIEAEFDARLALAEKTTQEVEKPKVKKKRI